MARAMAAGEVPIVPGFQGLVAGRPRHHAGPRRLGHLGGGAGGGAQGRPLRHLHRRRRRLHDRSADRREGAQDRPGDLRGDARDGVAGLQGAADALGRAGDESSRARAGAVVVRRGARQRPARHDGSGRGRDHGPGAREIRRERHRLRQGRGQDHGDARARPAGRRGGDLRPAGRRQHQRRHDRAERIARRQLDRHHLHRAARRPRARASSGWSGPRPSSSSPRSSRTPTSPRCR